MNFIRELVKKILIVIARPARLLECLVRFYSEAAEIGLYASQIKFTGCFFFLFFSKTFETFNALIGARLESS